MSTRNFRTLKRRATPVARARTGSPSSSAHSKGEGRPVADFLRRLTFTVLLGDNDAHAKNVGILHLPGRSVLADVYDAVPNLFQQDRINYDLALAIDRSFDHRCISAGHLIREAERWNALGAGEAERIVTRDLG